MPAGTARKTIVSPKPADAWMSAREAGRLLGIAPATVLTRVIQGQLEAQTVANRTVISRASVEKALAGA